MKIETETNGNQGLPQRKRVATPNKPLMMREPPPICKSIQEIQMEKGQSNCILATKDLALLTFLYHTSIKRLNRPHIVRIKLGERVDLLGRNVYGRL